VQKDEFVLVKFEEAKNRAKQLLAEGKCLQSLQGGIGIPNMHWCGQDEDSSIIVTELLGKNLRELKEECGGRLSLKSVLMIADSLLDIIHYLHFKMLYLRTVTPELFSVGSA
jgi:serine/threonine protein kinase